MAMGTKQHLKLSVMLFGVISVWMNEFPMRL